LYSTIKVRQRNISLRQIFCSTLAEIKESDGELTGGEQGEGGKICRKLIFMVCSVHKAFRVVQNNNGTSRAFSMRNTNVSQKLKVM
jgi:hypothetical protein